MRSWGRGSHDGWVSWEGETPESLLRLSLPCEDTARSQLPASRRDSSPDPELIEPRSWTSSLQNVRHEFLLFQPPVYGIFNGSWSWLRQEWIKETFSLFVIALTIIWWCWGWLCAVIAVRGLRVAFISLQNKLHDPFIGVHSSWGLFCTI